MKDIIKVAIKTQTVDFSKCKTDILAVGLFSDAKRLDKLNKELNKKLNGAIERLMKLGDFKAKEGTNAVVYGNNEISAKRILLLGLGEKQKVTLDTVRNAAANAAKTSVELKAKTMSLALHNAFGSRFDLSDMGRVCGEGTYSGSYRYDEFITENGNGRLGSLKVVLIDPDSAKLQKFQKGLSEGITIGKAQSYARTLANRPANVVTPIKIAAAAKELARSSNRLNCTVFDEKQMAAKGMGGVLAVGSGSQNKPRFIILKYSPPGKAASSIPTVALVGKAITFDSGGISIKPSANMDEMKLDKSGGIAVLGAMKAIAELAPPVNVFGIVPSAENMPSGASYRPGDIINTFSGKTVEIQNTDAEGRMILCDGINYAVKRKCDIIIDIATLTGACVVALGKYMAGLMGNNETLIKDLQKASEVSGEKVWPMPSSEEYAKEMKSKIADLKNIGSRWGGACTAAAFLRQFADDTKWAHLDIAGVWNFEKATEYTSEGASAFGVRLLTAYVVSLKNKKK
jgi:leucyl aminopeptidase